MHLIAFFALISAQSPPAKPIAPELLAKAHWVEGRVEIPAGAPAGERVEIVAHATGLPAFNDHSGAVDAAGRFKVAFAHDARGGKLLLRADYLFLDDEPGWSPQETASERILKPTLGARFSGLLARPPAKDPARDMEITLTGRPAKSGGRIVQREVSDSDGSFDFRGLACDHFWQISARAEGYCPFQQELPELRPGITFTGTFELRRGSALTGKVVDEAGSPIAGARLTFDCRAEPLGVLPRSIESGLRTGTLGEFRAAGLYPGSVLVRVEKAGLVPQGIELDDLKNDETRELSIVLKQGVVVHGKVVDPEGAPVAGARLSITQQRPGWSEYVHALETAPDGTFSCAGLSPLPMRVVCEKTSAERVLRRSVTADPRTPGLVVKLVERFTLRGRVLDDLGRTMLRYTAGVRSSDPDDPTPKTRTIDVSGKDGLFTIDDLDAGRYEVFVYGRGLVFEPARAIDVPHAADLVFTVRRPAVFAGRVVTSNGSPAAQALVELEWDRPSMFGGVTMKEETSVTASQTGEFELTEIYPGHVRVTVTHGDVFMKSMPAVDLSSGERRADVVLSIGP